jgi:lipopolysaccharide transport system permease protein
VQQQEALAAPLAPAPTRPVRRIRPSRGFIPVDFGELWSFRSLLYLFMWRDIRSRYRQTYLSGLWAIFRPLFSMVLFSIIFGGLAGIQTGTDIPYPLFVYPAILGWSYFSSGLSQGCVSVASNGGLIKKTYFPRLYAPLSAVTAPLTDLVLSLVILFGLFAWYQRPPSWHIFFLPVFVLLGLLLALGISLYVSGVTLRYRDAAFALPFLIQMWMYATPIIYPASLVPEKYRALLALNPATAVVEGFRWAILGTGFPGGGTVAVSVGMTIALVSTGVFFFRRTERTFADMM